MFIYVYQAYYNGITMERPRGSKTYHFLLFSRFLNSGYQKASNAVISAFEALVLEAPSR